MEIRHDERLKYLPVVILSTTTQKKTVEISYELGANLYLAKPNSFDTLKGILKEALKWLDGSRPSVDKFFVRNADQANQ